MKKVYLVCNGISVEYIVRYCRISANQCSTKNTSLRHSLTNTRRKSFPCHFHRAYATKFIYQNINNNKETSSNQFIRYVGARFPLEFAYVCYCGLDIKWYYNRSVRKLPTRPCALLIWIILFSIIYIFIL